MSSNSDYNNPSCGLGKKRGNNPLPNVKRGTPPSDTQVQGSLCIPIIRDDEHEFIGKYKFRFFRVSAREFLVLKSLLGHVDGD